MYSARAYDPNSHAAVYDSMKIKRYRSAFTTEQINYLEKQFKKCPYIGSAIRKDVANVLSIPERAIKIWFQNRRMKEKKEVNSQEYNLNRKNNLRNNLEIAKDSLNNVHSSQSANDHQYPLQLTTSRYTDNINCTNYKAAPILSNNRNKISNLKKDIFDNGNLQKNKNNVMINKIKQDNNRQNLMEPANLSKYGSNKLYDNKSFLKHLDLNKKMLPKNKEIAKRDKNSVLDMTSKLPRFQDSPEDLSAPDMANIMLPQNHPGDLNLNSAYIPFYNTQNVCYSPGNLIWKPLNVMPVVPPNSLPMSVTEKQQNINQNGPQKCTCDCNCHTRKILSYEHGNVAPQPQYVIAIPYNNNYDLLR